MSASPLRRHISRRLAASMTRSSVATAPAAGVASCTARLRPVAGSDSKAANPYHRLIKDYKLVSESLNDPVADARLAGSLFGDEVRSLRGMAQAAPDMFRCLRFLLGQTGGAEPRIPSSPHSSATRWQTTPESASNECWLLIGSS